MAKKATKKSCWIVCAPYLYFVFRLLVGLAFFHHGFQKLFGIIGGADPVTAFSLFWFVGVLELVGGAFIAVGFLTRYVAILTAIEMIFAWFMVHVKGGWLPIVNGGEPVLLFFAAFLVLIGYGAGKWGLDNLISKNG